MLKSRFRCGGRQQFDRIVNSRFCKRKWYYPAANKHVIGVMNYAEENGNKSLVSSSNFGDVYDICAPGNAIFSADGKATKATNP